MTVYEAIELLQAIKDKNLKVYLDCPNCGKSNEIAGATEVVVLKSKREG